MTAGLVVFSREKRVNEKCAKKQVMKLEMTPVEKETCSGVENVPSDDSQPSTAVREQ